MQMQKTEAQTQGNRDGRVEGQFPQPNAKILPSQAKVESNLVQSPHHYESPDADIEKKNFIEDDQMGRPRMLKPAKVDSQAQDRED
jgi:hypothetical protein